MARESTIGSTFMLEIIPASAPTPIVITSATAAKPTAMVTVSAAVVKSDLVRITGTGSKRLDRKVPHRVSGTPTATAVTVDTDNTVANGGALGAGGSMVKLTFQEVCFAEFGNDVPTPGEIDVTTMCDEERRQLTGLSAMGTATFGGPMDLEDVGVQALLQAFNDRLPRALIWKTKGGQMGMLYGVVNSFSGGPQGVEQAVTFTGSFQVMERGRFLPPVV